MEVLEATFKLVTPLVMAGANPNGPAEVRAPSIKGVLRYWYRAVDPQYREHEDRIFGGIGEKLGQSSFLLRVQGPPPSDEGWPPGEWRRDTFEELRYFSYSLTMGGNERRFIRPGKDIRLRLLFRERPDDRTRRAVAASLWLLGHVGGLGARSRRGFGTVALREWRVVRGEPWPELAALPLAHRATTPALWQQDLKRGRERLREWFGAYPDGEPDHTVLGPGARFCLGPKPARHGQGPAWAAAMDEAARLLRGFRNRRDVKDKNSDYHRVRDHLSQVNPVAGRNAARNGVSVTPRRLDRAPDRAAFGLPLTFRYRSLGAHPGDRHPPEITFQGASTDRSASRLLVRVVEIGGACYPLFVWLPGPLLPPGDQVKWKVRGGPSGQVAPPRGHGVVDAFFQMLEKDHGATVHPW